MLSVESLPLEILGHICDLLGASDDPTSVGRLACTSKQWYQVAGSRRFTQILFTIKTRRKLQAHVTQWIEILHRNAAFTAVRRLMVRGSLPPTDSTYDDETLWENKDGWNDEVDIERWILEDNLTCVGSRYKDAIWSLADYKAEVQHEDLQALSALVRQLSGLRDLYWSSSILFPHSLLEVLHQEPGLARCRLHIMVFKLPSLHQDPRQLHDIDSYDWLLATSPRLYTIAVPVSLHNTHYDCEYNGEAVQELVKLAPNLTSVHIITESTTWGTRRINLYQRGRPAWLGFFRDLQKQEQAQQALTHPPALTGHLTSLSLNPAKNVDELWAWRTQTAFSSLRTLQLWGVSRSVLLTAAKCSFPTLQALAIDPLFQWDPDGEETGQDDDETAQDAQQLGAHATAIFIRSLMPDTLHEVHLSTGTHANMSPGQAITAIIHHHGAALHTLSLTDSSEPGKNSDIHPDADPITLTQIKQIQASCPNLRDLRVPVRRGTDEVDIYRALGQFSQLRDLTLRLECITEELPHTPDMEEIRNLMIKAAVDNHLVEEIFTVVAQAQSSAALQRLHIEVVNTASHPLVRILTRLGRQWQCVRLYPNGISRIELRVQEIITKHDKHERGKHEFPAKAYESIFRSLWPSQTNNWEFDWRSFPLETSTTRPESPPGRVVV